MHLSTDHAAAQFVERVAWAISDAEDANGEQVVRRGGRRRARTSAMRSRGQVRVRV